MKGILNATERSPTQRSFPTGVRSCHMHTVHPTINCGSYDAIYQLAWALEGADTFDVDMLVTELEKITYASPLEGAGGFGAYDKSHCAVFKWPSGIALAIQWVNGSKKLVPAVGIYPSNPYSQLAMTPPYGYLLNMTPLALPDWGLYYYD